jgi:hypothetical protein
MGEMGIRHDLEAIWRQLEDCERTLERGHVAVARREAAADMEPAPGKGRGDIHKRTVRLK